MVKILKINCHRISTLAVLVALDVISLARGAESGRLRFYVFISFVSPPNDGGFAGLTRGSSFENNNVPRTTISTSKFTHNRNKHRRLYSHHWDLLPTFESFSSSISLSSIDEYSISPLLVVGVALGLGIAAQSFINGMLEGDQGLGAFLKDGSGYNKSGFRNVNQQPNTNENNSDPLPWLKLPKLDFVEVAGQNDAETVNLQKMQEDLELLRDEMNAQLEQGNIDEATKIRQKLETMMEESGIEYTTD